MTTRWFGGLFIGACLVWSATAAIAQDRPPVASPDLTDPGRPALTVEAVPAFEARPRAKAGTRTSSGMRSLTHLQNGGDRLVALQNDDGGWDWPLDDGDPGTTSPLNTVGPIAMGLAKAYRITGDAAMYAALQDAGSLLLTKTNNFSPSDGYLAAELDDLFGGSTYLDHVNTNFYGPLATGTYDRNGEGTLYDTAAYVTLIRTARVDQGIANLAAWDVGMGLVGAASAGVTDPDLQDWIDGVKGEIDELDGAEFYDVIGLAGAVYGLAFVGEDFDPTSGEHVDADSLSDLAGTLASYQILPSGGFAWNSNYVIPDDGNETVQETAYAILALFEVGGYLDEVRNAIDYLKSVQLVTGGWENYTGDGENNEVTAEAMWGIWRGCNVLVLEVSGECPDDSDGGTPGHQIEVELWMRDLCQPVSGFTAWLEFDTTKLSFVSGTYTSSPFTGHQPPTIAPELMHPERIEIGSYAPAGDPPSEDDSLLATLVFQVEEDCATTQVIILPEVDSFASELSYQGMPVATNLVDTPEFTLDDTPPVITDCPVDVTVSCVEDAAPGVVYGVTSPTGGVAIYYNDNGMGEVPSNQAYLRTQFDALSVDWGTAYVFDDTSLVGAFPFSWQDLYSGLPWPESQFGLDLILPMPTVEVPGSVPVLLAYDYDGVGPIDPQPVTWAINDYKPHQPDITAGVIFNSIVRGQTPPNPLADVEIYRNYWTLSGTVYTSLIEGKLVSDGIHHWYSPGTPDSPMSNFGLNGDFYFSGILTYDTTTDPDPLMDFYVGSVTLIANHPSAATGTPLAIDNCTLTPLITYEDVDNGGAGCPGDPLVITRTWTATDDCGNQSTCEQEITVIDSEPPVTSALTVAGAVVDENCEGTITFAATVADNCCLNPADVTVSVTATNGSVTFDAMTDVTVTVLSSKQLSITGTAVVSDLTGCPAAVTVTVDAEDCCDNAAQASASADVVDVTAPVIADLTVTGGTVDAGCEYLMPFSASVSDNCCINAEDVVVDVRLLTGNATLGTPVITLTPNAGNGWDIDGTVLVSALTSCPATVQVTVFVTDCCGNAAGAVAPTPDDGLWSESFVGGALGAPGNEVYAWSSETNPQWVLSGPALDSVVLVSDTVVGGNGERVYRTVYLGGTLEVDDGLLGGGGGTLVSADVVQHVHVTNQVWVGGAVDWSQSYTDIVTHAVIENDRGLTVTGRATFVGQGSPAPAGYPPLVAATGHWGGLSDIRLTSVDLETGDVEDDIAPVIACAPDVLTPADAGLCTATVTPILPTVTDNCDPDPTVAGVRSDSLPLTDPYPVGDTTITWTATDYCGNSSQCIQTVTVTATNPVTATVELFGVDSTLWPSPPLTRCIKFVVFDQDGCAFEDPVHVEVEFSGASPAVGVATFEIDCGVWTHVCAKDEQHTLYDTQSLTIVGTTYEAAAPLDLRPGDTDNDSDVDIHDVTWLMFQWGESVGATPAADGGCPWDGTRDGDFDNDNFFTTTDYGLLSAHWHLWTTCECTVFAGAPTPPGAAQWSVKVDELSPDVGRSVDFNKDGVVDYRDVKVFEDTRGLPNTLSTELEQATRLSNGGRSVVRKHR